MSEADPAIAARFKAARLRAGLTQVQAASDLGTDGGTVSRWERGLHPIPAAALITAEAWAPGDLVETPRRPIAGPAANGIPANAPTPDADPSWWAGYLAAANETLRHAHAMIGGANQQIAHMLANRAQWQRDIPRAGSANGAPALPDDLAAAVAEYDRGYQQTAARLAREAEERANPPHPRRRAAGDR